MTSLGRSLTKVRFTEGPTQEGTDKGIVTKKRRKKYDLFIGYVRKQNIDIKIPLTD